MKEEKIERLIRLLRRLDAGESLSNIRMEQSVFLATIEPKDICLAEQDLIKSGMAMENMRHLRSSHIQIIGNQSLKLRQSLPPEHVLRRILCEHEMIECFLADLLDVAKTIGEVKYISTTSSEFRKLSHIVHHLMALDQHHEREEQVIFPELERRGYFAPPQITRTEHSDVKKNINHLKELIDNCESMSFALFNRKLNQIVNNVVPMIHEHIFTEDNILYPTALQVIDDESVWSRMKAVCDEIGYCCFRHDV